MITAASDEEVRRDLADRVEKLLSSYPPASTERLEFLSSKVWCVPSAAAPSSPSAGKSCT